MHAYYHYSVYGADLMLQTDASVEEQEDFIRIVENLRVVLEMIDDRSQKTKSRREWDERQKIFRTMKVSRIERLLNFKALVTDGLSNIKLLQAEQAECLEQQDAIINAPDGEKTEPERSEAGAAHFIIQGRYDTEIANSQRLLALCTEEVTKSKNMLKRKMTFPGIQARYKRRRVEVPAPAPADEEQQDAVQMTQVDGINRVTTWLQDYVQTLRRQDIIPNKEGCAHALQAAVRTRYVTQQAFDFAANTLDVILASMGVNADAMEI